MPRKSGCLKGLAWTAAGLAAVLLPTWVVLRTKLDSSAGEALAVGKELLRAKRVLAVVAHPDDLEWYVGGTLASLDAAGAEVQVIVGTFGENGPNRTNVPDLAKARREEQMAAARINGYDRVHWVGAPDRGLPEHDAFPKEVARIWTEFQPDAVLAFDPEKPSMPYLHRDHQGSGLIVLEMWERMEKGRPALYLFQTRRPTVAVDISPVIDRKVDALSQHKTQGLGSGATRNRGFTRRAGELVGVSYAETFRALR